MLERFVRKYKKEIDFALDSFLSKKIAENKDKKRNIREVLKSIREFNLRGGKRIRPLLVLLGYFASGGKNAKEIIKASVAIEIMEAFLLIHDDIIDNDALRRGKLTINKEYEKKCEKRTKNKIKKKENCINYGNSIAIIAGDIALGFALDAILETRFSSEKKVRAISIFNNALIKTCFGQILDIDSNTIAKSIISEADIKEIQKLKTAIYTIEAPLHIGAALAGNEKAKKHYSNYAIHLGQAFQITDDILNIFGTKERIGKPVMSDIREGKPTLIIRKAMMNADKGDADFIKKHMGKKLKQKDITRIKRIIKQNALDKVYAIAKKEADEAKKHIKKAPIDDKAKKIFIGLADYILNRDY